MADIMVNMATVPRRTGEGRPYGILWPGVLRDLRVAGFAVATPRLITFMRVQPLRVRSWPLAGSRSSCGRLLGVGPLVAGFLESVLLWPASWSRYSCGQLPGVGHLVALFGRVFRARPSSSSRPVRQPARGRRPCALGA